MVNWKPYPHDSDYEVSDDGQVRSYKSRGGWARRKEPTTLSVRKRGRNTLVKINRQDKFLHRVVAETFLPPYPAHYVIRHKNGDTHDNRVANLEAVSRTEIDGNYPTKLTDEDVRDIRASALRPSVLARQYGVHVSHIRNIRRGVAR